MYSTSSFFSVLIVIYLLSGLGLCAQQSQTDSLKTQKNKSKIEDSDKFIKYSEKARIREEYIRRQEQRVDSLRKEIYIKYKIELDEKQSGIFLENQPENYPKGYIPLEDTIISKPYEPSGFMERIYDFLSDYLPSFHRLKFLRSKRVIYRKHSSDFGIHIKTGILSYEMLSYAPLAEISAGVQAGYNYRTSNYLIRGFIGYSFGKYQPWLPKSEDILKRNYGIKTDELSMHLKLDIVAHIDYYNRLEYFLGFGGKYRVSSYQKQTETQGYFTHRNVFSPTFSIAVEKSFRRKWLARVELESTLASLRNESRYSLSSPYVGNTPLGENTPELPFLYAWTKGFSGAKWQSLSKIQNFSSFFHITYTHQNNMVVSLSYRFELSREKLQRDLLRTEHQLLINWQIFW